MKNKAKAVLAILGAASAVAFSGPTLAQDTGFYAGISLGSSTADVDCTGATTCEDKDSAWKILGGYRFNRHIAVEVGYTNLGEISASDGVDTVKIESTAFEVVAVGSFPVADKFSVFGKLGMYRGETDASVSGTVSGSISESNTGLTFGAGVQYDFTKNLGARAEYQKYSDVGGGDIGESDVDVISIGVIFRF